MSLASLFFPFGKESDLGDTGQLSGVTLASVLRNQSILVGSGVHMGCQRSNPGQIMQALYLLNYCSGPMSSLSKFSLVCFFYFELYESCSNPLYWVAGLIHLQMLMKTCPGIVLVSISLAFTSPQTAFAMLSAIQNWQTASMVQNYWSLTAGLSLPKGTVHAASFEARVEATEASTMFCAPIKHSCQVERKVAKRGDAWRAGPKALASRGRFGRGRLEKSGAWRGCAWEADPERGRV